MRRKGTIAWVILASVLIAALAALAIYLTIDYRSTMQEADSLYQKSADFVLEEIEEAGGMTNDSPLEVQTEDSFEESESEEEWVMELKEIKDTPVIWVGDSRTVGMQKAVENHSEDVFIGESGEGYEWLSKTGISRLKGALKNHPDRAVIFNMGVNDYENITNYMDFYESLEEEYPDTLFYYLSVNPVDDKQTEAITNDQIDDFNESIRNSWPDTYIDSCSYLRENNVKTSDGVHYTSDGYRQIYLFVKEQLASYPDS